jgi:hypothetical protein
MIKTAERFVECRKEAGRGGQSSHSLPTVSEFRADLVVGQYDELVPVHKTKSEELLAMQQAV